MPRKHIIRSNEHFYHVTGRSNNKENFHLEIEEVWRIMIRHLRLLQIEYKLEIAAFVLMSNHYHLLLLTPEESIDRIMYFFMKDVTKNIQKRSGRINKIFGGRYKGCLIDNDQYLMNAYKYVYRNPVAAKLCENAENYPYSTLSENSFGAHKLEVQSLGGVMGKDTLHNWINIEFSEIESERIRFGLSRTLFKLKDIR